MTAHNSGNASNSRNESNNRTANTLWTPEKAGMLAKVVKLECRKGNYSRDIVKIRDDSSSIMSSRTARQAVGKSATAEETATFSRDTTNSSMNSQPEH